MPGRTLASFYGSTGETSESPQQSPREPFYESPGQESGQSGTPHQYDTSYYYPNVNQPSGYPSTQYAAPYSYSAPSQSSRHDSMSYPNSQGAYNATPGHYATPGHGQTGSGYAGGGQWPPQQAEFAAPAPAHAAGQHSLPGQFQRSRMPAVVGSPPVQHPAWTHTPPQAVPGGALAPSGYYPAPPQLAHRASAERQAWKPAHQSNGSPLFSLQMLVNQDHTRAAASAAAGQQVNNYEISETVDLSSTATPTQTSRPGADRTPNRNGRVSVPTPPVNGSPADAAVSSSSRPKSEPPSTTRPKPESPSTSRPKPESPSTSRPKPESPSTSRTKPESPSTSRPKPESPSTSRPKPESPSTSRSKPESPSTSRPKPESPSMLRPKHETSSSSRPRLESLSSLTITKAEPPSSLTITKIESPCSLTITKVPPAETSERKAATTAASDQPPRRGANDKTPGDGATVEKAPAAVESADERAKADAGKARRVQKVDALLGSLAAAAGREAAADVKEEAGDDGKPRRKRKLDKPVRVEMPPGAAGDGVAGRRRSTSEGSEAVAPPPPPPDHESAAKRQRRKSESDQPAAPVKQEPQPSPVTPAATAAAAAVPGIDFPEVETELEKMFAGMEEAGVTPPPPPAAVASAGKAGSPATPKTPKRDRRSRAKGGKAGDGSEKKGSGKKASGKKKGKVPEPAPEEGSKGVDSGSNASVGKIRGPLIRVRGDAVNVYNAPTQAEAAEPPRLPPAGRRKQAAYHSDLDYRAEGALTASMLTSTLSARYDAHTTDRGWLCVFCKAGPHSNTGQRGPANGDLFGPYLVAAASAVDAAVDGDDDRTLTAEQTRGGRNKKSLRKTDTLEQYRRRVSKKAKRAAAAAAAAAEAATHPPGMLPRGGGACYEVWTHESCALWAAGTRVVGSRVYGLQEAVWAALASTCDKCGSGGATVSCVARGCARRLHVDCALALAWDLDEDSFLARCPSHRRQRDSEPGTSEG